MADSQQIITTPPRRRIDNPELFNLIENLNSSESCKNTPNISRKLEHTTHHHHRHLLLEQGSQSAKSSPLPNRRLDKLEGVIRDKQTSKSNQNDNNFLCSYESSPIIVRRHQAPSQNGCGCPTDCNNFSDARRRVEPDCTCGVNSKKLKSCTCITDQMSKSECQCTSKRCMRDKNIFASPIKNVLGEPGAFNSPIHTTRSVTNNSNQCDGGGGGVAPCSCNTNSASVNNNYGSPAKSIIGEPGVFPSPSRSVCVSPCDDEIVSSENNGLPNDQTIVSGWLKFRDNKRIRKLTQLCLLKKHINYDDVSANEFGSIWHACSRYKIKEIQHDLTSLQNILINEEKSINE